MISYSCRRSVPRRMWFLYSMNYRPNDSLSYVTHVDCILHYSDKNEVLTTTHHHFWLWRWLLPVYHHFLKCNLWKSLCWYCCHQGPFSGQIAPANPTVGAYSAPRPSWWGELAARYSSPRTPPRLALATSCGTAGFACPLHISLPPALLVAKLRHCSLLLAVNAVHTSSNKFDCVASWILVVCLKPYLKFRNITAGLKTK